MKLQDVVSSAIENSGVLLYPEGLTEKETKRLRKVTVRRSIEEYMQQRRAKEACGELADLYELDFLPE